MGSDLLHVITAPRPLQVGSGSLVHVRRVSFLNPAISRPSLPSYPISLQRYLKGIQQILIAEWLVEEFNGARFFGPHRHGDITVTRNKNDRNLDVSRNQLALKIQPAPPR